MGEGEREVLRPGRRIWRGVGIVSQGSETRLEDEAISSKYACSSSSSLSKMLSKVGVAGGGEGIRRKLDVEDVEGEGEDVVIANSQFIRNSLFGLHSLSHHITHKHTSHYRTQTRLVKRGFTGSSSSNTFISNLPFASFSILYSGIKHNGDQRARSRPIHPISHRRNTNAEASDCGHMLDRSHAERGLIQRDPHLLERYWLEVV